MSTNGNKHHKSRRKPMKIIGWIVSGIQLALSIFVAVLLFVSGFFPILWTIGICILMLGLVVLFRFLMWHYHPRLKFRIGLILAIIVSILLGVASYYLFGVVKTLRGIASSDKEITVYGVYVLKDDPANSIKDAANYSFGYIDNDDTEKNDKVFKLIKQDIGTEPNKTGYPDMLSTAEALVSQSSQAIVLNEAMLDTIADEEGFSDYKDKVKEIASYNLETDIVAEVKSDDEPFTVFISGIDVNGPITTTSRSDVNIIATINPKTHQILLVSTPRDYFVPLSISRGVKDKLTHAGIYGINTSMDTLGMLYDTKVDYYFRINFTGFVNVIDALGGINVNSDNAFSANGYSFVKGNNYVDGKKALAFARERKALGGGDVQRGQDQMEIIKGVVNKILTPSVLNNYSQLLSGLESSFQTSVPYSMVSALVEDQLTSGAAWDVQTYYVNGTGTSSTTYSMPNTRAYVMVPDESTVEQAKTYINDVENGKKVTIDNKK